MVLIEDLQAALHEHIVVRLIPGRAAQFADAGLLGKGDPDFRHENSFEIEGDNGLLHAGFMSRERSRVQRKGWRNEEDRSLAAPVFTKKQEAISQLTSA